MSETIKYPSLKWNVVWLSITLVIVLLAIPFSTKDSNSIQSVILIKAVYMMLGISGSEAIRYGIKMYKYRKDKILEKKK